MKWLCKLGWHSWRLMGTIYWHGGVVDYRSECQRCGKWKSEGVQE